MAKVKLHPAPGNECVVIGRGLPNTGDFNKCTFSISKLQVIGIPLDIIPYYDFNTTFFVLKVTHLANSLSCESGKGEEDLRTERI